MKENEKKLKRMIISKTEGEYNFQDINNKTNLIDDLGFDSIKMLQLILDLEREFMIEIDDEDLDFQILSIYKNLSEMIERKLKNVW